MNPRARLPRLRCRCRDEPPPCDRADRRDSPPPGGRRGLPTARNASPPRPARRRRTSAWPSPRTPAVSASSRARRPRVATAVEDRPETAHARKPARTLDDAPSVDEVEAGMFRVQPPRARDAEHVDGAERSEGRTVAATRTRLPLVSGQGGTCETTRNRAPAGTPLLVRARRGRPELVHKWGRSYPCMGMRLIRVGAPWPLTWHRPSRSASYCRPTTAKRRSNAPYAAR